MSFEQETIYLPPFSADSRVEKIVISCLDSVSHLKNLRLIIKQFVCRVILTKEENN